MLNLLKKLFNMANPPLNEAEPEMPRFDTKYKVIVPVSISNPSDYYSMILWVNENSKRSVDIQRSDVKNTSKIFVAFESSDDALLFRVKYGTI